MKKIISKFFDDTLFLKDIKCIFCDDELDHFSPYCACETCLRSLPFNRQKVCQKCGEPLYSLANYCMRCKNSADRGFDVARAPFLYDGKIKQSVWAMKYYGKKYLAEYLSRFLYDEYVLDNLQCDIVIPVPLTAKKTCTARLQSKRTALQMFFRCRVRSWHNNAYQKSRHKKSNGTWLQR